MTRADIVAMFERRLNSFQTHDADALADDFAEDAVLETPSTGVSRGRDAIRAAHKNFVSGFDNISIDQEDLLIDGDEVVLVFKFRGTHNGSFLGVAATGKRIVFRGCAVCKLRDGKIAHEQRTYDFTGFLVKLGLLKARPA